MAVCKPSDNPTTQVLVAMCAALAAKNGALSVLAFAMDHECGIDPWDLPDPQVPPWNLKESVCSFSLEKTLLNHVEEETATRLLLGFPLPLAPLKRAHDLAMPPGGTERRLDSGPNAIQHAAQIGDLGVFDLMLAVGADYLNKYTGEGMAYGFMNISPLQLAVTENNHAVASRLLRLEGVDVNEPPPGVLVDAIHKGSIELLMELIEFGAEIHEGVLKEALTRKNFPALELFLQKGGDPNAYNEVWSDRPLLAWCCTSSHETPASVEGCRILLKHGADANQRARNGETALHFAHFVEMARALIENGAEVDAKDVDGKTPLHLVCEKGFRSCPGSEEMARVLLEAVHSPAEPSRMPVSLETLPVDVASLIILHLPLIDLESLLRTRIAVARLFRIACSDVSFAIAHVRRLADINPNVAALAGPDYSALPKSYALAAFSSLGVHRETFAVVFGDGQFFNSYYRSIGPKRNPRWIEDVLLELVRRRIVDLSGVEAEGLMLECAAMLDSEELAAEVLAWLCEPHREDYPNKPHYPEVEILKKQFLVAKCAASAAKYGALGVLAVALDHESEIDPWDLPSFLDTTLLMLVEEGTATRLLLGLPLPLSPLRRAEAVMLPPAGLKRQQYLEARSRFCFPLGLTAVQLDRAFVELGPAVPEQKIFRPNDRMATLGISLETLPVDIARLITLELKLTDFSVLLRTSTRVFRLFWINELAFAVNHLRRSLPFKPDDYKCPKHAGIVCGCGDETCKGNECDCDPAFDTLAASDTDFRSLPPAYALAVFVSFGFSRITIPVVCGDALMVLYGAHGPSLDPCWMETVLLKLVKQRLVSDRKEEVVRLLIEFSALLDSVDLASAILDWLSSGSQPSDHAASDKKPARIDNANLRLDLIVAFLAAVASGDGALGVLAFALNHPCCIDRWDLPWIDFGDYSAPYRFHLDKTLLLHATSGVERKLPPVNEAVVRLLLGLPLPLAPFRMGSTESSAPTKRQLDEYSRTMGPDVSALGSVIRKGDIRVFQMLVSFGADYMTLRSELRMPPLAVAAYAGHKDLVMTLLGMEGVDVNNPPVALAMSVHADDLSIMKELLAHGALVNSHAMFSALVARKAAVLEILLQHGGDPNASRDQRSLLTQAVTSKEAETLSLCKLLVSYGADINVRNRGGRTALHEATRGETARWLLEGGAEVDARDDCGWTPLHAVCDQGYEVGWRYAAEVGRALLEHGCDVNALTNEGQSPLDLMPDYDPSQELLDLLDRYGAKEVRGRARNLESFVTSRLEIIDTGIIAVAKMKGFQNPSPVPHRYILQLRLSDEFSRKVAEASGSGGALFDDLEVNEKARSPLSRLRSSSARTATRRPLQREREWSDWKQMTEDHVKTFLKTARAQGVLTMRKARGFQTFRKIFTGAVVEVKSSDDVKKLKRMEGVRALIPVRRVSAPSFSVHYRGNLHTASGSHKPSLYRRNELANILANRTDAILNAAKGGAGIRVCVVDTGVDYTHPALGGCFGQGCKVAFGHDFVGDEYDPASGEEEKMFPKPDGDPMDCQGHGTHVSGIIAANDVENRGVEGVAPNATLGVYKVFGCSGESDTAAVLSAMEQSFFDDCSILNLSIGSGSAWADTPDATLADILTSTGELVVSAAGNDQDIGIFRISSPAVSSQATGVGAVENTGYPTQTVRVANDTSNIGPIEIVFPPGSLSPNLTLVAIKASEPVNASSEDDGCSDYPRDFFRNYFALIRRGSCTFATKIINARQAGADGVILYNRSPESLGGVVNPIENFPVFTVSGADGEKLIGVIQTRGNGNVTLEFQKNETIVGVPYGGKLASFSSWGPALDWSGKSTATPTDLVPTTIGYTQGTFHNGSVSRVLAPVALQGNGLVNLTSAITSETFLYPPSLAIGARPWNAEGRVGSAYEAEISVLNNATIAKNYTVEFEEAAIVAIDDPFNPMIYAPYPTNKSSSDPGNGMRWEGTFGVSVDYVNFSINPGEIMVFNVTVRGPPRIQTSRLNATQKVWLYSGYLRIRDLETNHISVVSLMGVSGDFGSQAPLDNSGDYPPFLAPLSTLQMDSSLRPPDVDPTAVVVDFTPPIEPPPPLPTTTAPPLAAASATATPRSSNHIPFPIPVDSSSGGGLLPDALTINLHLRLPSPKVKVFIFHANITNSLLIRRSQEAVASKNESYFPEGCVAVSPYARLPINDPDDRNRALYATLLWDGTPDFGLGVRSETYTSAAQTPSNPLTGLMNQTEQAPIIGNGGLGNGTEQVPAGERVLVPSGNYRAVVTLQSVYGNNGIWSGWTLRLHHSEKEQTTHPRGDRAHGLLSHPGVNPVSSTLILHLNVCRPSPLSPRNTSTMSAANASFPEAPKSALSLTDLHRHKPPGSPQRIQTNGSAVLPGLASPLATHAVAHPAGSAGAATAAAQNAAGPGLGAATTAYSVATKTYLSEENVAAPKKVKPEKPEGVDPKEAAKTLPIHFVSLQVILRAYYNRPVGITIIQNTRRPMPGDPEPTEPYLGTTPIHKGIEAMVEASEAAKRKREALEAPSTDPAAALKIAPETIRRKAGDRSEEKALAIFDRMVEERVDGKLFCRAWSVVTLSDPEFLRLVVEANIGIGQLFRFLNVLPEFTLYAVGKGEASVPTPPPRSSAGNTTGALDTSLPEKRPIFWRVYTLSCAGMRCDLREEYEADTFNMTF
ncbi:hypothetical protein HDU96_001120 [Phlyctochytrium bullatum]|nr:hypothetical protein HDU96_001120 [Phlyctochytrium bullatum]